MTLLGSQEGGGGAGRKVSKMPVTKLFSNEKEVILRIQGYDLQIVNAIRRFAMSEVPMLAIDEVVILENTSPIYDEVLAHRLGLIPLRTPPGKYPSPEECKGESARMNCAVMLVLEAEASNMTRTVYSGELISPQDPEVKPISPNIPIAKLAPGQRIKLEAYARMGKGKEHSKWQPTTVSVVKPTPEIIIKHHPPEKIRKLEEVCPVKILKVVNSKLVVEDELKCTYCMECVKMAPEVIEVREREKDFILRIESLGTLPAPYIVKEAVSLIIKTFEEVTKRIEDRNEIES